MSGHHPYFPDVFFAFNSFPSLTTGSSLFKRAILTKFWMFYASFNTIQYEAEYYNQALETSTNSKWYDTAYDLYSGVLFDSFQ